ncbi:competence type IV pilus minor pilin ComGG [Bacillus sp. REN10]|uniref:competence type IV pilus minor pilin ComGG n=1 Tax=Bacillus sp. REN10 TaxID=2782541 RepID=UPI00193C7C55|nr:competence type IV pilus minor pilin ComGG [Bacillus sp. REN10]
MKQWIMNERGMLFPYVLLLFIVVLSTAILGVDIFVSKQRTAMHLTEYYETKVMELLALQHVASQLDQGTAASGVFVTNKGEVHYSVSEETNQDQYIIHLKTKKKDSNFYSKVIYDEKTKQMVKRLE